MNPFLDPKDALIADLRAQLAELEAAFDALETAEMIWRRTARMALRFAVYTQHQTLSPALQLRLYDKLLAQADDARRFTGRFTSVKQQGRAA